MDVQPIGSKHFSGSVSGVVQIINPAENVSGAIIRTASVQSLNWTVLAAGATKPQSATDFSVPIVMLGGGNTLRDLQYPISLPAGAGLWGATSGSATMFVTYDLLP